MTDILMRGINMLATGVYILSVDNTGTDKTIFTISTQTNSGKIIPRYVCEAVIVQPHGRLGDLNELIKHAIPENPDAEFRCVSVYDIDNAPTIIPASEEVQGV